jgi:glyoxylase-like metal-dependent hydrolase (beta-lactamase superfamily II)
VENPNINQLGDHVYYIEAPMNGRFPFCNSFLFTGRENILIDAGIGEDLMKELDGMFGIDTLVISHSHPDHIRSWKTFESKRLLLPAQTDGSVMDLDRLGVRYTGSEEAGRHWVETIGKPLGIQPFREPDGRFKDGDILDTGGARIQAIHAPGHLDDHYCFFEQISGTLITTDIDFTSFGPWYGNPDGRIGPFKESILKVMAFPYKRACSSHKPPIEGDATDRFLAFLDSFDRQKEEVMAALGTGKSFEELVHSSPFYGNKFIDLKIQNVFEGRMCLENLLILMEEGRVVLDNGRYTPVENHDQLKGGTAA